MWSGGKKRPRSFGPARPAMKKSLAYSLLSQTKLAAKTHFSPVHLAVVGFVIVSHQMKDSVKNQDAHLIVKVASKASGILTRNGRRNGDVAPIRRGIDMEFSRRPLARRSGNALLGWRLICCE